MKIAVAEAEVTTPWQAISLEVGMVWHGWIPMLWRLQQVFQPHQPNTS